MKKKNIITLIIFVALIVGAIGIGVTFLDKAQAQSVPAGMPRIFQLSVENNENNNAFLNIKLDRNLNYKIFSLPNPTPRIVIDMSRVQWSMGHGESGSISSNGLIKQIRYAHKSSTESRIVVDLAGPAKVVSQNLTNNVGGKVLHIELAPTNNAVFASNLPKPEQQEAINSLPSPISPKFAAKKYTIVIDAGHGGHDPGAIGFYPNTFEKSVTLASALYLRDQLKRDPRFNIVMTRDSDVFLPLEQRIIIARDIRADLFISLHADAAAPGTNAEGATVYTLSEEGGERSRRLLNRDNWTVVPPNRSRDNNVTEILRDLTQRDTKNQSAVFAENIVRNIRNAGPLTSSSHRRAGFFVLLSPTTPAVLLEMGFVTDKEDQDRLINTGFRAKQMGGVARAISEYFDGVDLKNKGNH